MTTVPLSLKFLLKGQMRFIREQGYDVFMASADGAEVKDAVAHEGVPHAIIPLTRAIRPIRDIRCIWLLMRWLRKHRIDMIHTHTPKAGLVGILAGKLAGVKVRLHTVAGLPLMEKTGLVRHVLIRVERLVYACATRVYPNSFHLHDFIRTYIYRNPKKLKVLAHGSSNGIDTSFFAKDQELSQKAARLRHDLGITNEDRVMIFIGRIVRDKGIHELVRSFQEVARQFPEAHLLMVGKPEPELDPLDPETLSAISEHPRIHELGWQEEVRVPLSAADILVFPSYREGFPNVPLQAGAMGLPSIVTNINGCNEIVTDGLNGLIVEKKDTHALQQAMVRLLTDRRLCASMARNARPVITGKFEQQVVWDAILQEYRSVLE